jgi:hypothetical protein
MTLDEFREHVAAKQQSRLVQSGALPGRISRKAYVDENGLKLPKGLAPLPPTRSGTTDKERMAEVRRILSKDIRNE